MALLHFDKFTCESHCEDNKSHIKYKTMTTKLKRIKTQTSSPHEDEIVNYVHKDNILKCNIFVLFYFLVMNTDQTNEETPLFANWAPLVKLEESGTNSIVSEKFKSTWDKIYALAQKHIKNKNSDEVDLNTFCIPHLSSGKGCHAPKKRGIQELGDSGLVPQVCTS